MNQFRTTHHSIVNLKIRQLWWAPKILQLEFDNNCSRKKKMAASFCFAVRWNSFRHAFEPFSYFASFSRTPKHTFSILPVLTALIFLLTLSYHSYAETFGWLFLFHYIFISFRSFISLFLWSWDTTKKSNFNYYDSQVINNFWSQALNNW